MRNINSIYLFNSNNYNATVLSKYTSLDFGNGIKALLSFTFISNMNEIDKFNLSLHYGWQVDNSTLINSESLNNCYSYVTKRLKTTLENLDNITKLYNLNIEVKPNSNEGKIFSHSVFDEGLR